VCGPRDDPKAGLGIGNNVEASPTCDESVVLARFTPHPQSFFEAFGLHSKKERTFNTVRKVIWYEAFIGRVVFLSREWHLIDYSDDTLSAEGHL